MIWQSAGRLDPPAFSFDPLQKPPSPYINRFLSADTIVPGYANPQNLNRYSYVTNNPLRYTDPTGHMLSENEYGGGCSTSGYCPGGPPPNLPEPPNPPDPEPEPEPNPESDLNAITKELLDSCMFHPYASNCSFAVPPTTCASGFVIGPPDTIFTPPGCHFAGFETYIDSTQIDWGSLFFDGLGVVGSFALAISTIGVISIPAGAGFYEATQFAGFAYDIYSADNDAITWNVISTVAEETDLGSQIFPGLGTVIDLVDISTNLADAQVIVPVYEPYNRPLPGITIFP